VQVGYYVRIDYDTPELNEAASAGNAPNPPLLDRLVRTIDTSAPRVTRYQIDWGASPTQGAPQEAAAPEVAGSMMETDGSASMADAEQPALTPPPAAMSQMGKMMMEGEMAADNVGTDYLDGLAAAPRLDGSVPPMPIVGLP
jgi:hypothetical protein